MSIIKNICTSFILITILNLQNSHALCNQNLNNDIQKLIDDIRVQYQIPGIEVSIVCPGEQTPRDFVSGSIDINNSTPLQANHIFQIGSETKSFTASILLQLESEGLLSIDDPISKWILEIPSSWKMITVKQLLNHTSGLFNITEADEFWRIELNSDLQKQWTPQELINIVVTKPFYFEPGAGFHYSNTNYILAGMIINAVTGKSVEDEMRVRLMTPLSLLNTYYFSRTYPDDILLRMAHGYSDDFINKGRDITNGNMSMADAAGAVVSTSHDTSIWFRALLTTTTILPEKQQKELLNLVDEKSGKPIPSDMNKSGYGLGVARHIDSAGNEIWYHGGGTIGYSSNMLWIKCTNTIVTIIINYYSENTEKGKSILTENLISYLQRTDTEKLCKSNKKI